MNELPQASGPHSVAVGRDVIRSIISTGDHAQIFVGDYERLSDAYIEPWPVFERVQLDHFVGREWLVAEVDAFLREHDRGYFVLEAGAGLGKTTFLAWLTRERGFIHHFVELSPESSGAGRALKSIAAQLVLAYHLNAYEAEGVLPNAATEVSYLLKLLKQAANQLAEGEKVVLVIDALDEAGSDFPENVLGLPRVLPKGVYVIVSQRPVPVTLYVDTATTPRYSFRLIAESRQNQDDMRHFLEEAANWPKIAQVLQACGETRQRFVSVLLEKCRGIWIYLHYVIHEIERGERSPLDLDALPDGMTQYYARYWQDWRNDDEHAWYATYLPLLAMLAAVQQAPTLEYLLTWTGVTIPMQKLRRLFQERWSPFLAVLEEGQRKRYRFYHATLQEFFGGLVDREQLTGAENSLVEELVEATQEAHHRLASYYLEKWGGMECGLPGLADAVLRESEESYGLRYLGTHLEAAGRIEGLHALLALETEGRSNTWYAAKERSGDIFGFLTDVTRAWHLAEQALLTSDVSQQNAVSEALGLYIRYALIVTSLRSLAQNIRPALLVRLVEEKIWTLSLALAYALQISDRGERVRALEALIPSLPLPLLRQVLASIEVDEEKVNGSRYEKDQGMRLLIALVPRLAAAGDIPTALAAIRALPTPLPYFYNTEHINMLLKVADHAPEAERQLIVEEALEAALAIKDSSNNRFKALATVLPYLPASSRPALFHEIVAVLRDTRSFGWSVAIEDTVTLLLTLGHYFETLPLEDIRSAILAVKEMKNEHIRIRVLVGWLAFLPVELHSDVQQEVLMIMQEIDNRREQLPWLIKLIPHLPASLQAQAVRGTMQIARAMWKDVQQGTTPPSYNNWGWGEIGSPAMWDARAIAQAMVALRPFLRGKQREEALKRALAAAEKVIKEEQHSASGSSGPSFVEETHKQKWWVGAVMLDVIACFPESAQRQLFDKLLQEAQRFKSVWSQAQVYIGLLPALSGPTHDDIAGKALMAIKKIKDTENQIRLLEDLIPYLSGSLLQETLQLAVQAMWKRNKNGKDIGAHTRRRFFLSVVEFLPPSIREAQMQQIWDEIRVHERGEGRVTELTQLAPYAPAVLLKEMLPYARLIEDTVSRVQAQVALSLYLSRSWLEEMVADIKAIDQAEQRAAMLMQIASSIPTELQGPVLRNALSATMDIQKTYEMKTLLKKLIPHFVDHGYIDEIVATLVDKTGGFEQSELLGEVISRLAARSPEKAAALLQTYPVEWNTWLRAISSLPEGLRPQGWISSVVSARSLLWVLSLFVPSLSETSRQELIEEIQSLKEPAEQLEAMIALLPAFPADELAKEQEKILQALTKQRKESDQERLIIALAPHLSGQQLQRLMAVAQLLGDKGSRISALSKIAVYLPEEQREGVLSDLLDELEALSETYQGRELLKNSAPALTRASIGRAIALAHTISDEFEQGDVLIPLVLRLAELGCTNEAMKEVRTLSGSAPGPYAYEDEVPAKYGLLQLAIKLAELDEPDAALKLLLSVSGSHYPGNLMATALAERLAKAGHIEQAWSAAWVLQDGRQPAPALEQITPYLLGREPGYLLPLFHKTLKRAMALPRKEFLATIGAMAPIIASLGGPDAAERTVQAIRDVGNWWP